MKKHAPAVAFRCDECRAGGRTRTCTSDRGILAGALSSSFGGSLSIKLHPHVDPHALALSRVSAPSAPVSALREGGEARSADCQALARYGASKVLPVPAYQAAAWRLQVGLPVRMAVIADLAPAKRLLSDLSARPCLRRRPLSVGLAATPRHDRGCVQGGRVPGLDANVPGERCP